MPKSTLEKVKITFELNKTIKQVRKELKERTK